MDIFSRIPIFLPVINNSAFFGNMWLLEQRFKVNEILQTTLALVAYLNTAGLVGML